MRDYAALNIVWGGAVAGLLRATNGPAPPLRELPVIGLAAFSISKALSKEKIGAWVRQPVVDEPEAGDPEPAGRGLRHALGELVTCSRCLGTWSSLGLVGFRVIAPREAQIATTILASAALNDFLQAGFSALCAEANRATAADDVQSGQ